MLNEKQLATLTGAWLNDGRGGLDRRSVKALLSRGLLSSVYPALLTPEGERVLREEFGTLDKTEIRQIRSQREVERIRAQQES